MNIPAEQGPPKHPILPAGWNNCPKCGWAYLQSKLQQCPMCRHEWRFPPGYAQPPYESPALE